MKVTSEKNARQKKPYVSPQVTRVQLASEEIVLGACKTASGSAGSKSPAFPCKACGAAIGS